MKHHGLIRTSIRKMLEQKRPWKAYARATTHLGKPKISFRGARLSVFSTSQIKPFAVYQQASQPNPSTRRCWPATTPSRPRHGVLHLHQGTPATRWNCWRKAVHLCPWCLERSAPFFIFNLIYTKIFHKSNLKFRNILPTFKIPKV